MLLGFHWILVHISQAKISASFPNALTNGELVKKVAERLKPYGYGSNSLVATSLCCDEVNRPLEKELAKAYDEPFVMGGLAGFPFGGGRLIVTIGISITCHTFSIISSPNSLLFDLLF